MGRDAQVSDAVLVHGSFSSDLSWAPVLEGLRAGGLTPHPVCLPGHGRRGHETSPEIDLQVHAQAIVDYVDQHDLTDVMLVGHSYGGMPATQAWDDLRDRVAAVVYVDAGVPSDGQCQLDLLGDDVAEMVREIAADNGGMLPAPVRDTETFPLSAAVMTTPLSLRKPLPVEVPRTLVLATDNPGYHHQQADQLRGQPDWTVVEVASGHNIIAEQPEALVEILLTVAAGRRP